MAFTSTSDSLSIFKDGKLKPGVYKIQSLYNEAFLDVEEHSREIYCRPFQDLREGRGLWEFKPLEAGYTIRRVEPGKPGQYCAPMDGLENGRPLSVSPYPVAWGIEIVNDDKHRGFEYVRFRWGTTKVIWDVQGSDKNPGSRMGIWTETTGTFPWWIWKLIPVKVESFGEAFTPPSETLGPDPLPSYNRSATGQSSHNQHTESERDDFGTIVTEVITTRRRYRVEDA